MVNFLNTKNNMVFLFVVFNLVLKNTSKSNNNILTIIFVFLWFFYVNIGLEKCKLVFIHIQHTNNLNTNLLNGIMLIHPFVLYFFYIIYLLEYKVILKKKFFLKKKYTVCFKKKNYIGGGFLVLVAILLGGW